MPSPAQSPSPTYTAHETAIPTAAAGPSLPLAKLVPIITQAEYNARYPTADESLFFPGLTKPASATYASSFAPPLEATGLIPVMKADTTARDVHRRLRRLLPRAPSVAIFPYLIAPLSAPARKKHRSHRTKTENEKFFFTFASMMNWELGERQVRLGLVKSLSGKGGKAKDNHIWVAVVANREDGRGKDLIIFDESAQTTEIMRVPVMRNDILAAERSVIELLKKVDGIKPVSVWWGGRQTDAGLHPSDESRCLEASLRFAEQFSVAVEKNGGMVSREMLVKRWHMQEI